MKRRARVVYGLYIAAALLLAAGTVVQASTFKKGEKGPHPCGTLVASPLFAEDGTALCAGWKAEEGGTLQLVLWRTRDGGFSWEQATTSGLAPVDQSGLTPKIMFSPMYKDDGRIFIAFYRDDGLWSSEDLGESFEFVDLFGTSRAQALITSTDAPIPLVPQRRVQFVEAWTGSSDGSNNSVLIDAETHLRAQVKGTPGRDKQFAISPAYETDGRAYAVAELGVGETHHHEIFRCDAIFNCSEHLFTFPNRLEFDRVFFPPDFEESSSMFVSTVALDGGRTHMWRSDDAGSSFAPWESVQAIFDRIEGVDRKGGLTIKFGISGIPGTKILFLRIYYFSLTEPSAWLYRSSNGGDTWKLRAFGRLPPAGSPSGTMSPYGLPSQHTGVEGHIVAPTKDRMLMLSAEKDGIDTVRCSLDRGRTWQPLCPSPLE